MSLTQRTTAGILWNFAEQLGRRGIGIVVTLLLARFLTPDDYGLVSMVSIFLAIASSLMDMGFNSALIRKEDANDTDYNTVFYLNLALGFLAYTLLFIASPYIAEFYNEPELTLLVRVIGIIILINSFQDVQFTILSRNLMFKTQLKTSIPASIISGTIAVVMAYSGFGVWALVAQTVTSSIVVTVILWSMNIWRPTSKFSKRSAKEMFGFGSKLLISGLLDTVFQNLYVAIIAKLFATTIAGYYFFASRIRDLIFNQLLYSIQNVTYPALASIQQDDVRLKAGYRKVIQVSTFLLFPVMAMMAAVAEPAFQTFLPEKWYPAVPYLQLLCISGLMQPLHVINLNILKVKGRSDLFLYLEVVKKSFVVIVLMFSVKYGIMGILIGQIATSFLSYVPNSYYSGKLINYSAKEQIYDFIPSLVLSGSIATLIYYVVSIMSYPALLELTLFGALGFILYLVASYLLKIEALKFACQMIKDRIRR